MSILADQTNGQPDEDAWSRRSMHYSYRWKKHCMSIKLCNSMMRCRPSAIHFTAESNSPHSDSCRTRQRTLSSSRSTGVCSRRLIIPRVFRHERFPGYTSVSTYPGHHTHLSQPIIHLSLSITRNDFNHTQLSQSFTVQSCTPIPVIQ